MWIVSNMAKSKKKGSKNNNNNKQSKQGAANTANKSDASSNSQSASTGTATNNNGNNNNGRARINTMAMKQENLDTMDWLRYCETHRDEDGESVLQLEYQENDIMMQYLERFLEESIATKQVVEIVYQIWQQTVLSTLLASSKLWRKENVTSGDQRQMKERLKLARYKINFILHHTVGAMLTSNDTKWKERRDDLMQLCFQTLQLLPRLAESVPHHKTDVRQVIIHFEGKEFLSAAACETWDTLYDYGIPMDPERFIPVLRRCAMLDILDKDWNMLGGWEDILKGLEAKCCPSGPVRRLPCDSVLHEQTTILRNARNSMQCKFFSVRFMRYTEDQAPQRWRYFPKCSAPACSNIESSTKLHPYRCRKCWYFHYCSRSCMEYCDEIMGLHPKFCKDTPTNKAALCQKETETYLICGNWNMNDPNGAAEVSILCNACGATEEAVASAAAATADGQVMKRCSKCQKVYYCSRQCQEWDWRHGGHKQMCTKAADSDLSLDANESGVVVEDSTALN